MHLLHLLSKLASITTSPIQDCDEVFNYWEPLHYLIYGFGFQTWEYVPRFALRSWAFLSLFQTALVPFQGLFHLLYSAFASYTVLVPPTPPLLYANTSLRLEKVALFYATRLLMAAACWASELFLYKSIQRHLDARIADLYLFFASFAPGLFIASSSLLPSTFGMVFITLAFALCLGVKSSQTNRQVGRLWGIILCTCIAGVWGWPFCLAFGGFFIISRLAQGDLLHKLPVLLPSGLFLSIIVTLPLFLLDSAYYTTPTLAPWNLLSYNILSAGSGRGPELYGTEPWWYYFANAFLNFNLAFVFCVLSVPLMMILYLSSRLSSPSGRVARMAFYTSTSTTSNQNGLLSWKLVGNLAPFYAWLAIFSLQPHKEERFLYVVYPILCFNASVGVHLFQSVVERVFLYYKALRRYTFTFSKLVRFLISALFLALSLSRIFALLQFYGASLSIYNVFSSAPPPSTPPIIFNTTTTSPQSAPEILAREVFVCAGKEWYRFPSHFHLPHGMRFKFIKSRFNGLLPHYFAEAGGGGGGGGGSAKLDIDHGIAAYVSALKDSERRFDWQVDIVNDLNLYVDDRVIDIKDCDYLIDRTAMDASSRYEDPIEPNYHESPQWRQVSCLPFLDASKTKFPARAFYFGNEIVWQRYCVYVRA